MLFLPFVGESILKSETDQLPYASTRNPTAGVPKWIPQRMNMFLGALSTVNPQQFELFSPTAES